MVLLPEVSPVSTAEPSSVPGHPERRVVRVYPQLQSSASNLNTKGLRHQGCIKWGVSASRLLGAAVTL